LVRVCGGYREHFGQTRDDRILEFREMNDRPVVGLWAGELLRIEGGEMLLLGARARIFRKGQESEDVEPGSRLDGLLGGCAAGRIGFSRLVQCGTVFVSLCRARALAERRQPVEPERQPFPGLGR
jgi:hypothetical protein